MGQIRTKIDGHIAWLLFDRPEKLNAMTIDSWREMGEALTALGKQPEVRVLILAGEGRAFLAGHDVGEMRQHTRDFAAGSFKPAELHEGQKMLQETTRLIRKLRFPVIAAVQGYAQLLLIQQFGGISGIGFSGDNALPTVATIISLIAGTMFLVWLGELITDRGIGNGISLIIFGGIVAGLPGLIGRGVLTGTGAAVGGILLLVVVAIAVVALIVYFQEAQRRIPVQYARSSIKRGHMYRQQGQSHIPLRVNSAGMIPLLFAVSIMIFQPVGAP